MFLLPSDFSPQIEADELSQLTQGDDSVLTRAIINAEAEVASYLRQRYDTETEMRPVTAWAAGSYKEGDRVTYFVPGDTEADPPTADGPVYFYVAKEDTNAVPTDATKWTKGDDRNAQLVTYAVDCALYFIFQRMNPRQVPDLRVKRYDDAVAWLKCVNNGDISAGLVLLQTDNPGGRFRYGSSAAQTMAY